MKTITQFTFILLVVCLTSCKSTTYYQVYKTKSSSRIEKKDQYLVYEDENCKVFYDLWADGGNIGFKFYNKSPQIIYLNTDESFFVLNGIAHDYYQNKITSTASSMRLSQSNALSGLGYYNLFLASTQSSNTFDSHAVAYIEKKQIAIPPQTAKFLSEYVITTSLYRDCDLYRFPQRKETSTTSFSTHDSPFKFSNRIAYQVGDSGKTVHFENAFYVSQITNYPEKEITNTTKDEFCGETAMYNITNFDQAPPDKFYIKYTKGQNNQFKH